MHCSPWGVSHFDQARLLDCNHIMGHVTVQNYAAFINSVHLQLNIWEREYLVWIFSLRSPMFGVRWCGAHCNDLDTAVTGWQLYRQVEGCHDGQRSLHAAGTEDRTQGSPQHAHTTGIFFFVIHFISIWYTYWLSFVITSWLCFKVRRITLDVNSIVWQNHLLMIWLIKFNL